MIRIMMKAALFLIAIAACGGDHDVKACDPSSACTCMDGVDRDTACVCAGGSTCTVDGDSIEFTCDGNAGCNLVCGNDCLITCPGTTMCTVELGDKGVVTCPGTAQCDVLCHADCSVSVAGTADAIVRCENEATGATCTITGCTPTDCGNGVHACGTACPPR
jgi:hypothetical protein